MNIRDFDSLTRTLGAGNSRRQALKGFGGGAIAVVLVRLGFGNGSEVDAAGGVSVERKRRRKGNKAKKLQLNAFRCVEVGKACRGNSANCCSGICDGQKPKKGKKDLSRCIARNALTCQAEDDICASPKPTLCGTNGICTRTTGNASFCGESGTGDCRDCRKDTDCEADFGPGAACIVCAECEIEAGSPTACIPPASA